MRSAVHEIDSNGHGFPASGSDATSMLETVETTRLDQAEREDALIAGREKPAWWLLYAMLPLTALVFRIADVVPASSGWRPVSELFAALMIFLGIGLWLRANRIALMQADYQ